MKYQIIYADPPWSYNDEKKGFRDAGASSVYPTQSIEWICNLPIKDIADKNCTLFLWATNPLLPEAFKVIEAWGFKYVTVGFCWIKETPLFNSVANLGRWTMGAMEICLIARKGSPKRINNSVRQLVYAQRTSHSKKPDEVRQNIVVLMGDIPRVELFARQKAEGWDAWGNEVQSDIKLEESV